MQLCVASQVGQVWYFLLAAVYVYERVRVGWEGILKYRDTICVIQLGVHIHRL
jgi:hypothetical protein